MRPAEQYYKCFGCGRGGDVFSFVMEVNSISFQEARQLLADRAHIRITEPRKSAGGSEVVRADLLRANEWAAGVFRSCLLSSEGRAAESYLASRGLEREVLEAFQVGYAADSFDRLLSRASAAGVSDAALQAAGLIRVSRDGRRYDVFRNRIMFPIIDLAGRTLGFGGRTLGDDPAKYINSAESPLFSKSTCLYGLHKARAAFSAKGRAVIVEGYTDVLMAHQHGFAEVVATLGTALTAQHPRILRRFVPHLVLLFDGDQAGSQAAERGLEIALEAQMDVSLAQMPGGVDPCEFFQGHAASDFERLLISAPSALEFKWQQATDAHKGGVSVTARQEAVREFLTYVGMSQAFGKLDAIPRGLLINQVSGLIGVAPNEIGRQIELARQRASRGSAAAGDSDSTVQRGTAAYRPGGVEEAAMLDILTVLLCEPGLYPRAAEVFVAAAFADEQLRRIAQHTVELIDRVGEFPLTELLGHFDCAKDAARIVSLRERGLAAGQLEARLKSAVERLAFMRVVRKANQAEQAWFAARQEDLPAPSGTEADQQLAEIHHNTREYASVSNFAGIRKIRINTGLN